MTQPYRFEPDLGFIRDVVRSGGDSVKKCFQCATCSVVCPLSPDDRPFPRKEMIQTQWGMKDRLVKDPDIWLCHNCNDCSTNCPRGAKPGDVLNTLRRKALEYYSIPKALAVRVGDPKSLPLLLAIPAILFAIVIAFTNSWGKASIIVHGETIQVQGLVRSWKMIPMLAVDIIFMLTMLFAVVVFAIGITRFWKDLDAQHRRQMGIIPAAIEVLQEILTHRNFKECGTSQDRYLGHLGIFYGFIALFIVTTCIFVGVYFLGPLFHLDALTPWAQYNPIKLLANLGGIAALAGALLVIRERRGEDEDATNSYFDWFLLGLVIAVVSTGLLAEIDRLIGIAPLAPLYYLLYFAHLICVWAMFAYSPYSKLGHVVYRTVALVHAKASGRYLMQRAPVRSLAAEPTRRAVGE